MAFIIGLFWLFVFILALRFLIQGFKDIFGDLFTPQVEPVEVLRQREVDAWKIEADKFRESNGFKSH